jgi:hypothetical protein
MTGGTPCAANPVTVAVSGWSSSLSPCEPFADPVFPDFQQFSVFNVTGVGQEVCSRLEYFVDVPPGPRTASYFSLFEGGRMYVRASFSRRGLLGSVICQPGFVAFRVSVTATFNYGVQIAVNEITVSYSGDSESACVPIASLSPSGGWLAGRSVQVLVTGGITSGPLACSLPPQTLTVAFS